MSSASLVNRFPSVILVKLLEWYLDSGVDWVLADEPVNQFAVSLMTGSENTEARTARILSKHSFSSEARGDVSCCPGILTTKAAARSSSKLDEFQSSVNTAKELALASSNLEGLKEAMRHFDKCALRYTAKQLVFADGNRHARLMIVGEAPGRDEDLQGIPFVGRAGKLLDKMLAAIGLTRAECYITNVIPWRPPGNRAPSLQEIALCYPFIERHIELVAPKVLLMLGGSAVSALTGCKDGIFKVRGNWMWLRFGGIDLKAIATLHPAYLLRQPLHKRFAWSDLCSVRDVLSQLS